MSYDLKIVSGGQTGVDQGALESVFEYMTSDPYPAPLKIHCGGTAPKGFYTEDGANSDLYEVYGLKESPTFGYESRTKQNIIDSDGTLLIYQVLSGGSFLTETLCDELKKPLFYFKIQDTPEDLVNDLHKWIILNDIKTLNVAGHRESKSPGIHTKTKYILHDLYQLMEKELG